MDAILKRAGELKQTLLNFVLDAEGDLAVALETYAAQSSRRQGSEYQGSKSYMDLVIDRFLTAGKVGHKTPLDCFIESHSALSEADLTLLNHWRRAFTGLFAVTQFLADGFQLMNWLTAKHYLVKPNGLQPTEQLARLQAGEIVLTRITPVTETDWMFSTSLTLMGKLGKPKLAVAIGNFKQSFKADLYGDAPELLLEAWHSVEEYHQEFMDFFGSEEVTLPGYQVNQKLKAFQERSVERRLEAAKIDSTRSLQDLVDQAGISQEELAISAQDLGADTTIVTELLEGKLEIPQKPAMAIPQINLPDPLQKAEVLTMISHPRWGQMFLPTYYPFKKLLETDNEQNIENAKKLVYESLKNPQMNAYVWHHLAHQHPKQLEQVLQISLKRPNFDLTQDLDNLLQEFDKPLYPELPEIASVPLHLHNLFQEAVQTVYKSQSKQKIKQKTGTGFQR